MEGYGNPEDTNCLGRLRSASRGSDISNEPGRMTSPSRAGAGCRLGGRNWTDRGIDEDAG